MGPTISQSCRGVLEGQAVSCLVTATSSPFSLCTPTLCTQTTPASCQPLCMPWFFHFRAFACVIS